MKQIRQLENGCDISGIRAQHVLQILIRDNAWELKSANLKEYIEFLVVKNYFSVSYEQHQNGPAESSINSIMLLNIEHNWLSLD